jgi:hypothetical protein
VLKSRVEQANSLKARLLNDENQSDAANVEKMASEYAIMFDDIRGRLKTLKKSYSKPQSKRSVRIRNACAAFARRCSLIITCVLSPHVYRALTKRFKWTRSSS